MARPVTPIQRRIMGKFLVGDGCWEWTSSRTPLGYGQISNRHGRQGSPEPAYRVVYEVLVGPIPEGLELDHLCRNPGCVRPSHLEPVTHQVNIQRGWAAVLATRTSCSKGHPFTEENTYWRNRVTTGQKERICRECYRKRQREGMRRQRARRREERAA